MRRFISSGVARLLMFLWAVTVLFPLFWIVMVSFKTKREFFAGMWTLPSAIQFDNYARMWNDMNLSGAFLNTLFFVGLSMLATFVITVSASYSLSRIQFPGRKLIYNIIMLSLFLPGINAFIPTYILMRDLRLINSLSGLVILSSVPLSAFNVMVLCSFIKTIPYEMEESAFIDGASFSTTLIKIIMPMALPGTVTVMVFAFLSFYNSFLYPLIMLGAKPDLYPISLRIYEVQKKTTFTSDWVGMCACIVIGMIPSVVFYVLMQKRVNQGITVGALKG